MKKPIFIAHRGAWDAGRRENSVGAIERAASSGRFSYIELDVRRTRSDDSANQTPIVIHDKTLDRLYDKYRVPARKQKQRGVTIYQLTLDLIRSEDIDIPTLAEAMRSANGHPLNLEIKSAKTIEPLLSVINDMVEKYDVWTKEKIVISSFDWDILRTIKERDPELGIALLYGRRNIPRSFGRTYHSLGARWIMFNKWFALILAPFALLQDIPQRYAYTVNNRVHARILQAVGINGITTDSIRLPEQFD